MTDFSTLSYTPELMKSLVKGTLFGWSLPRINHYWEDPPPPPPRLCTLIDPIYK